MRDPDALNTTWCPQPACKDGRSKELDRMTGKTDQRRLRASVAGRAAGAGVVE